MSTIISNPVELRRRGFECLVASLGWVNAVRFMQQYDSGQHDYTQERDAILPEWDVETLVNKSRERISRPSSEKT